MPQQFTRRKKIVKFTESSILIFTIGFFNRFCKKFSLVKRFSVRFIYLPVQSTNFGFFIFCRFYWTSSETYRAYVECIELLVKFL